MPCDSHMLGACLSYWCRWGRCSFSHYKCCPLLSHVTQGAMSPLWCIWATLQSALTCTAAAAASMGFQEVGGNCYVSSQPPAPQDAVVSPGSAPPAPASRRPSISERTTEKALASCGTPACRCRSEIAAAVHWCKATGEILCKQEENMPVPLVTP